MTATKPAVDPRWETQLRPQYVEVAKQLCPRRHHLPSRLYSARLINGDEEQRLNLSKSSDTDLALEILDILRNQKPGSFDDFCDVLLKVGDDTLTHVESCLRPSSTVSCERILGRGTSTAESHGEETASRQTQTRAESERDCTVKEFANKVMMASDHLGGFWQGWSQIPVEVVHCVCKLAAEKPFDLADCLLVTKAELFSKPKTDVNTEIVRNTLETWVTKNGEKAMLDVLFSALNRLELFETLKVMMKSVM